MAQKFNWGAALTTLGGGIGDYAETKRREMAMKMLRDQQVADLADQRAYDDKKWLERLNITDPLMPVPKPIGEFVGLPENQVGPMPGMNLPQYERTSTVGQWQNMMPPAPAAKAPMITWTDPVTKTQVTTSYEDYLQYTRPDKETGSKDGGYYVTDGTGDPVFYQQSPSMLDGTLSPAGAHRGLPLLRYAPGVPGAGGGGGGIDPIDLKRRADQITEDALGPSVSRVGEGGVLYDESFGGTAARREDVSSLLPPEVRRAVNQAAWDSTATGRYPVTAPTDALVENIWSDVAPRYAEVAIPGNWEFRAGDPNTTADDVFFKDGPGPFNSKKKPLEFFKEFIVPQVNAAKDEKLGWQALVNSAGKYGLDPDDLKPFVDKNRFQQFFGAAQDSVVEDKIKKIFGGK